MSNSDVKIYVNYGTIKSMLSSTNSVISYYNKPSVFNITNSLVEYIENRHHNSPTTEPIYPSFIEFFRQFTKVVQILLTSNTDENLLSEILDSNNLSHLTKLSINTDVVTALPESIGNLSKLIDLEVINTRITSLPESFTNLSTLTRVILSFNNLLMLPENIDKLENLKVLVVNNNLTSLPESIGNLSQLSYLSVSHNDLSTIPESIGNLTQLRELIISHNHLTSLPESIGNLTKLTLIFASHNKLTSVPATIGNLSELYKLDLEDNHLTSLPESIGNLSKLSDLLIMNNKLTSLPESMANLSELEELAINNRVRVPESLKKLVSKRRERGNANANANNTGDLTNNMFTLYANKPKSAGLPTIVRDVTFDSFMPDIVKNMTAMDILVLNTYSFRGDYFINKFLSSNVFDVLNINKNTYTRANALIAFRNLDMFKKLIKKFHPNMNLNADEFINFKQEMIYNLFVMTYNTVVRVNKMIKEKMSWAFTTYRGSKTHYLKDMKTKQFYYFDSFVSTTTELDIAVQFSIDRNGSGRSGPIYVFLIDPACYYCYLSKGLTKYPHEKEVLLTPYHRYYFVKKDNPFNGHEVYRYYVTVPDLEIPNTFDTFLEWKDTVKTLSANKKFTQNGGKMAVMNNQIMSLPRFVNTRKNMKNMKNTKLNMKNTRKNMQAAVKMDTRKNIRMNTQKNTKTTTQKVVYDMERAERWTEPLSYFPGKEPTQDELALINKIKASF